MEEISVLIVDDNPDLRENISDLLMFVAHKYTSANVKFRVIQELTNGQEFLDWVKYGNHVDVVILDLGMPVLSGINALKELVNIQHNLKILVYSDFNNPIKIIQAIEYKALGFVGKGDSFHSLFQGIINVKSGQKYLSPSVSNIYESIKSKNDLVSETLSKREFEILDCYMQGGNKDKISKTLFISPVTVNNHKKSIFKKLDSKNLTDLFGKLKELGWYIILVIFNYNSDIFLAVTSSALI